MRRSSIACLLLVLASTSLRAQTGAQVRPLGPEFPVAVGESPDHHLATPEAKVLGQREFLVTWDLNYQRYSGSQLTDWGSAISGRKVSLLGAPVLEELVLEPFESHSFQGYHRLASDAAGRFAILWQELDSQELLLRLFDPDGSRLETTRLEPSPAFVAYPYIHALGMDPSGRLAAAWTRQPVANGPTDELWMQLFDATASPVDDSFQLPTAVPPGTPALAMARGNAIVAYYLQGETRAFLVVQRFDSTGRSLGPRVPVVGANSAQSQPAIAANPEGRFVVVWLDGQGVGARLFDPAGKKIGPVIRVSTTLFPGPPDVAMDARGNFVVVWQVGRTSDDPFDLRARVFNRDGVPQGEETVVASPFLSQYFTNIPPSVAFSDAGTFLAAWTVDFVPAADDRPGIEGRALALLRDDDRCVWRDGTFLCDTAYDGNLTHQQLDFGRSGDRPLLADFDGDGLDNPCVRRGNAFRCARPGRSDLVLRFGRTAHTPLAGDLDGDGDDDPCVRRGRAFLCDTAHNGGAPEVNIPLGLGSDEPLLGDLDADGDDDPCLWRPAAGTFLCDANHDGTLDYALAVDAQPGDRPLLGDLDGNGFTDFCFARDETLFCDGNRDGVLTEETLATEPGDVLVLGNVDGV
jgi:hypothetical protein